MSCRSIMSVRTVRRHRRAGFSLPELMVVIVIIGLMAGVATVSVRSYLVRGKQNIAKMEIAKICESLDAFYAHYDRYPTAEEGIAVLAAKTTAFPDGLLSKVPNDPWGYAYEYVTPGSNGPYEVVCYGGDHRQGGTGGDADISSVDLGQDRNKTVAQEPSPNVTR
jgi:general secretion pathway protein G